MFDNAGNRIPFSTRGRIIAHCAARTACPHFGLLVGQQAGLQSFGMVGLLMKSAPDVGTAVRGLVRHLHLHVRGATMALEVHGDLAVLRYEIYQPRVEGTEQVSAGAVAVAFNVMRQLVGSDWRPIEVRFAHRKPEDVKPFHQFFGVPLRFDAKEYAVVFSATRLARGMPDTDPELRRLVQEQIDKLERLHGDDFPEQVRSVLRHALVAGDATADRIAAVFSMQRRTLRRRLNAFGTCFQTVADEVSFAIARQLLEGSGMDFGRIAAALDYANASAFTRAFRRWSGATPAQWRTTATGAVQDTGRESAGRAAHSRNEKRQPAPSERR